MNMALRERLTRSRRRARGCIVVTIAVFSAVLTSNAPSMISEASGLHGPSEVGTMDKAPSASIFGTDVSSFVLAVLVSDDDSSMTMGILELAFFVCGLVSVGSRSEDFVDDVASQPEAISKKQKYREIATTVNETLRYMEIAKTGISASVQAMHARQPVRQDSSASNVGVSHQPGQSINKAALIGVSAGFWSFVRVCLFFKSSHDLLASACLFMCMGFPQDDSVTQALAATMHQKYKQTDKTGQPASDQDTHPR